MRSVRLDEAQAEIKIQGEISITSDMQMTEDKMFGWHHWLSGHEFEQAPGDGGQGSLACCNPWGPKESDTAEQRTTITPFKSKERTSSNGDSF